MRALLIVAVALLLLVGVHFLLSWLASRRRVRIGRAGGVAVLRQARGRNAVLGALALGPALLFAVLPFAMRESGPGGRILATATTLVALAVSGYFFAAEARKRVRVDEAAIDRIGVFTHRRLPWSDVAKIAYNPTSRWFFVVGRDGTRIWIYESFEGVGDFAELALSRLPPAVLAADASVREELAELAAESTTASGTSSSAAAHAKSGPTPPKRS